MAGIGQIVILNGPSRAGKTSIAAVIQQTFEGIWMGLGMDLHIKAETVRLPFHGGGDF